ncbi:MAG: hypothetical protein QM749_00350 [Aquabacterium sp.]
MIDERIELEHLDGRLVKPVSESALQEVVGGLFGKTPSPGTAARHAQLANTARAMLQGMRVLLVEDNELHQQLAQELIGNVAGAEVVIADNGLVAIAKWGRHSAEILHEI